MMPDYSIKNSLFNKKATLEVWLKLKQNIYLELRPRKSKN